MRRERIAAIVAACAVAGGCGGGSSKTPAEKLQGSWRASQSDGCAIGVIFKDHDEYESIYACELDDGSFGYESYRGHFFVDGDSFTWTTEESSCPDADTADEDVDFEFAGKKLRLATPGGVTLMERIPESQRGTASAEYGCFDEDDYFNPMPVKPL